MLTTEQARAVVAPFYEALNQPAAKNVRALIEEIAAPDWRSFAGEAVSKGREEFIQQVIGFGKAIPDLTWEIKEVLVDGERNRVIVRSEARGTPAGAFMGTPHSGKRFAIMTLDVHTVAEGKLLRAHHVEDWASAIRQLQVAPVQTQYIEAVRFRLKAGAEPEQLVAAEKAVRGVIHGQPGYQGRDLFNDEAGNWFIVIRWDTKVASEAWSAVFKTLAEGRAFGALMDFSSARQEHFSKVVI